MREQKTKKTASQQSKDRLKPNNIKESSYPKQLLMGGHQTTRNSKQSKKDTL